MSVARHSRNVLLFIAIAVPFAPAQTTQTAPPSCSQPELRQFDFWVGQWDLSWPGTKPEEVQHGHNTVRTLLDNCVVQEQFDGGTAIPLRGLSVSAYNPALKMWQQTWVDNQGAYLDFIGEFVGGEMVLSRHGQNQKGQPIEQRMVYKNIAKDSFDWSWEQSTDSGKTWAVAWPIHYARAK